MYIFLKGNDHKENSKIQFWAITFDKKISTDMAFCHKILLIYMILTFVAKFCLQVFCTFSANSCCLKRKFCQLFAFMMNAFFAFDYGKVIISYVPISKFPSAGHAMGNSRPDILAQVHFGFLCNFC